jgi:hypothetical protein
MRLLLAGAGRKPSLLAILAIYHDLGVQTTSKEPQNITISGKINNS